MYIRIMCISLYISLSLSLYIYIYKYLMLMQSAISYYTMIHYIDYVIGVHHRRRAP